MASTQDTPMQVPNPPLNVKEQLEEFLNSVSKKVPKGLTNRAGVEDDATNRTSCNNPNGIQGMLNTMFASCTMGHIDTDSLGSNPSLLKNKTVATSALTPSSSNGETSAPHHVTPSPLHRKSSAATAELLEQSRALFKSNHDIAQEAIHRLRKQHQLEQSEKLVSNSLYESEVAVDTERMSLLSARSSMFSNNQSTLSYNPSTLTNNRTLSTYDAEQSQIRKASLQKLIANRAKKNANVLENKYQQEHSFFPASTPDAPGKSRKEKRVREKLMRNKGVPKEVTSASPMRMLKNRNNERQKRVLNTPDSLFNDDFNARCEANANDSWDIENDGISDITQSTVDRMVLAISQHVRVFPEEAEALTRIHSDVTDPAPKKGAMLRSIDEKHTDHSFPILSSGKAGFSPPRTRSANKSGMTPAHLQRTYGSTGTQSFFTKTTHSTATNDFANAWKIDEQKFWDSEVAKESPQKHQFRTPTKHGRRNRRGESSKDTITTATVTTPNTLFTSPQTPPSFFREAEITFPNDFAEITTEASF